MKELRDILIEAYLDFRNNYASVGLWAEHNGLSKEHGEQLYWLAREVFESKHPEA